MALNEAPDQRTSFFERSSYRPTIRRNWLSRFGKNAVIDLWAKAPHAIRKQIEHNSGRSVSSDMRSILAAFALLPAATYAATPVTYSQHIAPILFKNCASCHRPGEAAPFSLLTYDDAKKRAADRILARFEEP